MALYEYRCRGCGATFERLVRAAQERSRPRCPHCGTRRTQRLPSRFSSRISNGTSRASTISLAPTSTSGGCGCGGGCSCRA
ncbi:MAG: zinc ribbon domain-containing protein [Anaerolineae bacterium]|nr:zinc ribbon domain-containing protein [Anaerolineae bacterium]